MLTRTVVTQLHLLFEDLRTSKLDSVEPTRDLVELILLRGDELQSPTASVDSGADPDLVQMDQIASQADHADVASSQSTIAGDNDVTMIDTPSAASADGIENDSDGTLVDEQPSTDQESKFQATSTHEKDECSQTDNPIAASSAMDLDHNRGDALDDLGVTELPPPIPPRNKPNSARNVESSKAQKPVYDVLKFGAQHDASEVIGRVTDQLQWAIRPTGFDSQGNQVDEISDLLYGSIAEIKRSREVDTWSYITAFPNKDKECSLYDALDVRFDEQMVMDQGQLTPSYSSIVRLPPVLQIHLMRTAFDTTKNTQIKISTTVDIPETLYLDRYMDASDESVLMSRRREAWKWKAALAKMERRVKTLRSEDESGLNVLDALQSLKGFAEELQADEELGIDVDPEFLGLLEHRIPKIQQEIDFLEDCMAHLNKKLREQYTDMTQQQYQLHSVFIHRGTDPAGGHYWIYIYDFENDLWRMYNDEKVSVVKDRSCIFRARDWSDGTPYLLTYVRSQDRHTLVDAVCREVQLPQHQTQVDPEDLVLTSQYTQEEPRTQHGTNPFRKVEYEHKETS